MPIRRATFDKETPDLVTSSSIIRNRAFAAAFVLEPLRRCSCFRPRSRQISATTSSVLTD